MTPYEDLDFFFLAFGRLKRTKFQNVLVLYLTEKTRL